MAPHILRDQPRCTRTATDGDGLDDLRARFRSRAAAATIAELAPLVEAAATLDAADPAAAGQLREDAQRVTARLAAAGHLPPALVVDRDDPTVVVIRTLAHAPRRVTPRPAGNDEPAPDLGIHGNERT